MAHRIVKKTHHPRHQEQSQPQMGQNQNQYQAGTTPNFAPTSNPNMHQNANQPKLPRPILIPCSSIPTHNKIGYRNGLPAFPMPQSLFISPCTYDAGPDIFRPSSAILPSIPKKSPFPLGAWICPFGRENITKIRVNSPIRCTRCKAYINGYWRFDGGKKNATCNICGIGFEIASGGGVDMGSLNSAEVATQGVIDFVVKDKIFMKKRVDIVKVIIGVEINNFMIQSGGFATILESVRSAIQNTEFEKNIRIGVITFNGEGVTYLKAKKATEQQQQAIKPKKYKVKYTQNLCCPLSDHELLFNPNLPQQKLILLSLLQYIKDNAQWQYKNGKNNMVMPGNYALAVKSLMQGFQNQVGRIMLFASSVPRGVFGVRVRNQQDNKNPTKPLNPQYPQLAKQLSKSRIGLSLHILSQSPLASSQLSTTHSLCSHTGGSLHLYSPFSAQNHNEHLYYTIYSSLSSRPVYDINFTARVSNGLNIAYFGIGDGLHQVRDIGLGVFGRDMGVAVGFEQEEKLEESIGGFMQFAMLFTTGDGDRILRVVNYRFGVGRIDQVHEACDYLTVANLVLRGAASKILRSGDLVKVRQEINTRMTNIVSQYVQQSSSKSRISSFLAHPNLSPCFAYIHSFINSKIFLNPIKVQTDYLICQCLRINTYSYLSFANYFYPKLFPITLDIYDQEPTPGDLIEGQGVQNQGEAVVLPASLPLTGESLSKGGLYLCWNAQYLTILVQHQCPPQVLLQLFQTDNWSQIQQLSCLPEIPTSSHNIRISLIISELRRRTQSAHGIYLPLIIRTPMKKGPYQEMLNYVLKEDYPECRYYGWMDGVHRAVQGRMK